MKKAIISFLLIISLLFNNFISISYSDFGTASGKDDAEGTQSLGGENDNNSGGSESFKDRVSEAWGNVKSNVSKAWGNVKSNVSKAWGNVKSNVSKAWGNVKSNVSKAWGNVKESLFGNGKGKEGLLNDARGTLKGWGKSLKDGFTAGKTLLFGDENGKEGLLSFLKDGFKAGKTLLFGDGKSKKGLLGTLLYKAGELGENIIGMLLAKGKITKEEANTLLNGDGGKNICFPCSYISRRKFKGRTNCKVTQKGEYSSTCVEKKIFTPIKSSGCGTCPSNAPKPSSEPRSITVTNSEHKEVKKVGKSNVDKGNHHGESKKSVDKGSHYGESKNSVDKGVGEKEYKEVKTDKKEENKKEKGNPSIIIEVKNENQKIEKNKDSNFKIKITNNGNESLKNISLNSDNAKGCSGIIKFKNGKLTPPINWKDFKIGGQNNNEKILESGEYYEFTCSEPITTESFTNIFSVGGVGIDSGKIDSGYANGKVILEGEEEPFCGTADKHNYYYEDKNWGEKSFCLNGSAVPKNPNFPDINGETTWKCVVNGKSDVICKSKRNQIKKPGLVIETQNYNGKNSGDKNNKIYGFENNVIRKNSNAKLKITIKNNTKKDLKEISIDNSYSKNCKKESGIKNGILKKGEIAVYICSGGKLQESTTDIIKVSGVETDTGIKINKTDEKEILITNSINADIKSINLLSKAEKNSMFRCFGNLLTTKLGIDCNGDGNLEKIKIVNSKGNLRYADFICDNGTSPKCFAGEGNGNTNFSNNKGTYHNNENGNCGDGIVQNGEGCDRIDGNFPKWCDASSCEVDLNTLPGGVGYKKIINGNKSLFIEQKNSEKCNINSNKYADNEDYIILKHLVRLDKPLRGKKIEGLSMPNSFFDIEKHNSDRINSNGSLALKFEPILNQRVSADRREVTLEVAKISSVAPLNTCGNTVKLKIPGLYSSDTVKIYNVNYHFKKPFIGKLSLTQENGNETGLPIMVLGTSLGYKLSAQKIGGTIREDINYKIHLNNENIKELGDDIKIRSTTLRHYSGYGPYKFSARIDASENATKLNNKPGIEIEKSIISYKLDGKKVVYYLSDDDGAESEPIVKKEGKEFIGIKIIGGLQGNGKYEFTGQEANISDLSNLEQRTKIRKRAYEYVSNMQTGEILNKIYYKKGDLKISEIANKINNGEIETLVINDGNLIIDENVNKNNANFGIIVLKDNYDINNDFKNKGNIFVKPDITEINAIIYADGGFISADDNGNPYIKDTVIRTENLQKQLFMNGSLFTRNTIGGSIYKDGYYLLPGNIKVQGLSYFDKAMLYDLNYLRRGNKGCDKSNPGDGDCNDTGEFREGFIIKYNPKVQNNPPKLFSE